MELLEEDLNLFDVLEILEYGYEVSKRKPDIIEKCLRKGNKSIKAVVVKCIRRYPDGFEEEVWRLIHVGKFKYKKGRQK